MYPRSHLKYIKAQADSRRQTGLTRDEMVYRIRMRRKLRENNNDINHLNSYPSPHPGSCTEWRDIFGSS